MVYIYALNLFAIFAVCNKCYMHFLPAKKFLSSPDTCSMRLVAKEVVGSRNLVSMTTRFFSVYLLFCPRFHLLAAICISAQLRGKDWDPTQYLLRLECTESHSKW